MSFHSDVQEYLKEFAPAIGPVKLLLVNQWVGDIYKSTAVVGGMAGNGNPTKKQWKVYYSAEELTHTDIPVDQWLEWSD